MAPEAAPPIATVSAIPTPIAPAELSRQFPPDILFSKTYTSILPHQKEIT
jgi:hypothetical protein